MFFEIITAVLVEETSLYSAGNVFFSGIICLSHLFRNNSRNRVIISDFLKKMRKNPKLAILTPL